MIVTRIRIYTVLLLLTSLAGFMEWGTGSSAFLFETEMFVLSKMFTDFFSVLHPLILLPLAGQLMLLAAVFQRRPSRFLLFGGIILLSLIMVVILIAGILGVNPRMVLSVAPFFTVGAFTVIEARKVSPIRAGAGSAGPDKQP